MNRMIKNEYVYSIITRFITIIISLCQSILVARYLGAALKGTSVYIKSITSIGAIIVTFGMHQAYPFFRKKYGKDNIFIAYINAVRIIFATEFVICIVIASVVSNIDIKISIFLIPIMGFADVLSYVCMIESPNIRNKWWTIIYFFDMLLVAFLMLFTSANLLTAVMILTFADVFKIIVYSIIVKTRILINKQCLLIIKEIITFGFFPMLALLMTTLNYRIDVIMLKMSPSITDELIGIYSIGINVAERIVLVPDTLKGILASKLSKGADNKEVSKICRLCLYVSLILCIAAMAVGKWGICLLYGSEYNNSYTVMSICALGAVFIGYFKLIAQYNIINKKQIYNVIILSISILVNIVGNLLFIPAYGINGAALATCLGHIVCGAVFIIQFCKNTNTKLKNMVVINKNDLRLLKKIRESK